MLSTCRIDAVHVARGHTRLLQGSAVRNDLSGLAAATKDWPGRPAS
jgi:hypothetical protein